MGARPGTVAGKDFVEAGFIYSDPEDLNTFQKPVVYYQVTVSGNGTKKEIYVAIIGQGQGDVHTLAGELPVDLTNHLQGEYQDKRARTSFKRILGKYPDATAVPAVPARTYDALRLEPYSPVSVGGGTQLWVIDGVTPTVFQAIESNWDRIYREAANRALVMVESAQRPGIVEYAFRPQISGNVQGRLFLQYKDPASGEFVNALSPGVVEQHSYAHQHGEPQRLFRQLLQVINEEMQIKGLDTYV
ncbi:hypothetical protein COY95_04965 [Candidatus Woesearchaeota archaeon CG_4_10_14_0_8_um_filter_47_5]|nr:MAG: hypothetical protein COY95_04965 [Candidatus Woesearchaeota archaeon CG_4_10_14_0_8_um_filter_47_5]